MGKVWYEATVHGPMIVTCEACGYEYTSTTQSHSGTGESPKQATVQALANLRQTFLEKRKGWIPEAYIERCPKCAYMQSWMKAYWVESEAKRVADNSIFMKIGMVVFFIALPGSVIFAFVADSSAGMKILFGVLAIVSFVPFMIMEWAYKMVKARKIRTLDPNENWRTNNNTSSVLAQRMPRIVFNEVSIHVERVEEVSEIEYY